jgi:NADH:ubiquinone reductase (H+-translocating)
MHTTKPLTPSSHTSIDVVQMPSVPARPRVVIVGAGFGGLTAAKALAEAAVDITVVDRHNHHLFQPLLYQVATAALSPADIASPIRAILGRQRNASVVLDEVSGIDAERHEIICAGRRMHFDYLVLATGARHAYFGNDGWERYAKGIKTIDDAILLRRKILIAFERAEAESGPAERKRLLTFVVVGGGATGVEIAGAIAELAQTSLAADFRAIRPVDARIILVEGGPRLLPTFDGRSSEAARRALVELGVEVRLATMVTGCDAGGVAAGEERIESRTVVWAAGVQASRAGAWLKAQTDRAGRVIVGADLSLPGHPNTFVIGDTAHALDRNGRPLPGVAPVARGATWRG